MNHPSDWKSTRQNPHAFRGWQSGALLLTFVIWWGTMLAINVQQWWSMARTARVQVWGSSTRSSMLSVLNDFRPDLPRACMFKKGFFGKREQSWQWRGCQNTVVMKLLTTALRWTLLTKVRPDHVGLEAAEQAVVGRWDGGIDIEQIPVREVFFRHNISRIIHMQEDEPGLKFVCGRDINASYLELESRHLSLYSRFFWRVEPFQPFSKSEYLQSCFWSLHVQPISFNNVFGNLPHKVLNLSQTKSVPKINGD